MENFRKVGEKKSLKLEWACTIVEVRDRGDRREIEGCGGGKTEAMRGVWLREKAYMADALASEGEEGRTNLRKAQGSR